MLAVESMVKRRGDISRRWALNFRNFEHFEADLNAPAFDPCFVFIEPHHGVLPLTGPKRNSQHPPGSVAAGDALIKSVYDAIRNSPIWTSSLLVITYDEHGGFYDRRSPPDATAPGDAPLNRNKAEFPADFDFRLMGVRVPAVIVSPWIEPDTTDDTIYDHTSILKTIQQAFGIPSLTKRDKAANGFGHLLRRSAARIAEDEALEDVSPSNAAGRESETSYRDPLTSDEIATLRIAMSIDHILNQHKCGLLRSLFDPLVARLLPSVAITPTPWLPTPEDARDYVAEVAARLAAYDSAGADSGRPGDQSPRAIRVS